MSFWQIIGALISTGSWIAFLSYMWSAWKDPRRFIRKNTDESTPSIFRWIYTLGACWGAAMAIYAGTKSALYWLPEVWGRATGPDDTEFSKSAFAIIVSVCLITTLIGIIGRSASAQVELEDLKNRSHRYED